MPAEWKPGFGRPDGPSLPPPPRPSPSQKSSPLPSSPILRQEGVRERIARGGIRSVSPTPGADPIPTQPLPDVPPPAQLDGTPPNEPTSPPPPGERPKPETPLPPGKRKGTESSLSATAPDGEPEPAPDIPEEEAEDLSGDERVGPSDVEKRNDWLVRMAKRWEALARGMGAHTSPKDRTGRSKRLTLESVRSITPDMLRAWGPTYELVIETFAAIPPESYRYRYTTSNENPHGDTRRIAWKGETISDTPIGAFFGDPQEDRRQETIENLRKAGLAATSNPHLTVDEVVSFSRSFLQSGAELVKSIQTTYRAQARVPNAYTHFGGQAKRTLMNTFAAINANKRPDTIAYAMRLEVPRWMRDPIPVPKEHVPSAYAPRLRELWSGYSSRDAHLLIGPSDLEQGHAPLHKALTAARTVEAEGHADQGYAIKTAIITHILDMEARRFDHVSPPELPFFTLIFPGAMTGDIGSPPKNAPFDYSAAVIEIMNQTWERLAAETASNQPGMATKFFTYLNEYYHGDDISPYLARSIARYTNTSGDFDMIATLKGLQKRQIPGTTALVEHIKQLPNRPILTNQEAKQVTQTITSPEAPPSSSDVAAAASSLAREDEDTYSFRAPLPTSKAGTSAVMTTHVVPFAQTAYATIRSKTNGEVRSASITVDLETGSTALDTIDQEPLGAQTLAKYQAIVGKAILDEKAKIEAARQVQEKRAAGPGFTTGPSTQEKSQLPRKGPRVKTRGEAYPSEEIVEVEPTEDDTRGRVSLTGWKTETVNALLKKQGIREVNVEAAIEAVNYLKDAANTSNKSFGKLISHGVYGGGTSILRQVRVTVDGRPLRFYFAHRGKGVFELYGVLTKEKGLGYQYKYIGDLLERLDRERRA